MDASRDHEVDGLEEVKGRACEDRPEEAPAQLLPEGLVTLGVVRETQKQIQVHAHC